MSTQEYFNKIIALPRAQQAVEVERLEPPATRDEVHELVAAHNRLEDEQGEVAAAIVSRFTLAWKVEPGRGLDSYLDSPEIASWYHVEFFKSLLKTERQLRKSWNFSHSEDEHLSVDYPSYWNRKWFSNSQYSLATIAVLIEEDGYIFKEEIGAGGMGRVLLVCKRGRDEALKVANTKSKMWNLSEEERKRLLARFEREIKALSEISHRFDHLPTLYHAGQVDGLDYFTMAYLPGLTLSTLLKNEDWTVGRVITRMLPLARLIHGLHTSTELSQNGDCWVHRDLHPDNFIWDEGKERVYLIDFGLARPIQASGNRDLTEKDTRMGRRGYWPPELSSQADERSDVFTFAATLYFMLTKRPPIKDGDHKVFPVDPPSHSNPSISVSLDRVLLKALEPDPEARFQTMAELANALESCQTDMGATTKKITVPPGPSPDGDAMDPAGPSQATATKSRRSRGTIVFSALIVALLGVGGAFLFSRRDAASDGTVDGRDGSLNRIRTKDELRIVTKDGPPDGTVDGRDGSLDRIREKGELLIATEDGYPPMTFRKDGQLVGFDVDFANELARRLGVKARVIRVDWKWKSLVSQLNAHKFDVLISTVTETEDRLKEVDFVEYLRLSTSLVTKKGLKITREEYLRGKTVVVQKDTRAEKWVEDLMKRGFDIRRVSDSTNATAPFAAIREGKAQVTFAHEPVAHYYANRDPELEVSKSLFDHPEDQEKIGIVLCQKDQDLRKELQRQVSNMSESHFIGNLREKWIKPEIDGTVKPLARKEIPERAVIAHRGASHDAPESTVASYVLARDLGADYLELDLQRSKDGELIVVHDDNLKRTTNVSQVFPDRSDKPVSDFTLAELKRLDAGTWFNQRYRERARSSFTGLKILTLDEVINIIKDGKNRPGLYIETKKPSQFPGIEKQLKDKLKSQGWIDGKLDVPSGFDAKRDVGVAFMPGRVILQTFEKDSLELLQKHMPEIPKVLLLWLGEGGMKSKSEKTFENSGEPNAASFYAKQEVKSPPEFVQWLDLAKSLGAIGIGSPSSLVNGGEQSYMDLALPWMNRLAHDRALLVHAYAVDEKEDFRRLVERGVDGFFTNRPAVLLEFYERPSRESIDGILKRNGF